MTIAGPSFPAKRTREPASFANGLYRPELKPMQPPSSEHSAEVTAQLRLSLAATVLMSCSLAEECNTSS